MAHKSNALLLVMALITSSIYKNKKQNHPQTDNLNYPKAC